MFDAKNRRAILKGAFVEAGRLSTNTIFEEAVR